MSSDSLPAMPYITAQGRDLRLDLLRGYFVFAMVIDHVRGPSPLYLITGGNRFFAGAAEGFILTSGLIAGVVYSRLIQRDGMGRSFLKVLKRAFSLYLLTVALTLIVLPASELLNLPWAQGVNARDPISVIVSILTLHRTAYLVDVMLLYTVFFLLTPLALLLIEQGQRWWVLGASWLLWGLFQLWPDYAALPWPIAGNYLFSFSAWQVIFFTGLVFGYGRKSMPILRPCTARILLAVTGLLLIAMIALFYIVEPPTLATPAPLRVTSAAGHDLRVLVEDLFLNKVDERPGRLFAAAITFTFLFLAVSEFWGAVRRALGWLLLPLGQQALYAYTAHVVLVPLVALAASFARLASPGPQWLNGLIQAGSVALIWTLVRFQIAFPTPRTQLLYRLSPILFTGLAFLAFYLDPTPAYPGLTEPALAGRVAVNRFGTPLPPTPTPTATPAAAPAETPPAAAPTPTPSPIPTYESPPLDPSLALERVRPYLYPLDGTLKENWFYSRALDREMPYWVYLPPDYNTAERRYPVIYMLHGRGGHRDEWIAYEAVNVADREMAHGVMRPMIIIMPQGDTGFWVNNVGNGPRWGDYVTQDLITEIDSTFRTLREPGSRGVGGLSMGGFGALTLAFTHPEVFGAVSANSPSLPLEQGDVAFLGAGDEFARRDPVVLAATAPALALSRIWIDTDEADPWLERTQLLVGILVGRQLNVSFHVFPGSHDYEYWSTHVIDYLHFYEDALARQ